MKTVQWSIWTCAKEVDRQVIALWVTAEQLSSKNTVHIKEICIYYVQGLQIGPQK